MRALLGRVGSETYAMPLTHVAETVAPRPGDVERVEGRPVLYLRGRLVPLIYLRERLAVVAAGGPPERGPGIGLEMGERRSGGGGRSATASSRPGGGAPSRDSTSGWPLRSARRTDREWSTSTARVPPRPSHSRRGRRCWRAAPRSSGRAAETPEVRVGFKRVPESFGARS